MSTLLQVGSTAPGFSLPNQNGDLISLDQLLKQSVVVLYFYPRDNTPGCTMEAKSFRDHYHDFVQAGAQVVGVSTDSVERHCAFRDKHDLPFQLLSDSKGDLARQYGVAPSLGFIPGRETFIIGQDQTVRHAFKSQFNAKQHVVDALKYLNA